MDKLFNRLMNDAKKKDGYLTFEGSEHNSYTKVQFKDGRKAVLDIPPSAFLLLLSWCDGKIVNCADLSDPELVKEQYEQRTGRFTVEDIPSLYIE